MEANALMLVALIGAHFFFDYAGQGDFMAKAKNCASPIPGVPAAVVLWSHGAIHGAAAALITGLWPVFLAETVLHSVFDDAKCRGLITYKLDQALHVGCKFAWFGIAFFTAK
jgi:hypothetical protein